MLDLFCHGLISCQSHQHTIIISLSLTSFNNQPLEQGGCTQKLQIIVYLALRLDDLYKLISVCVWPERQPKAALLVIDAASTVCRATSSKRLVPGDVIVVLPGTATCDLVLLQGTCLVEESNLSGEVKLLTDSDMAMCSVMLLL